VIGSTFEIKLPPKHIEHQREMPVWEGAARHSDVYEQERLGEESE